MLQIRLLGQFDIRLNKKRITITSRVAQSLFAYLALTAGTSHRREKLAGIFWPDTPEENGRKNLRQELWRIRKALSGGSDDVEGYLLADEYTVGFNRNSAYWLDVAQLEKPDPDLEALTSSLSLYQGELLPGFYEDWIVLERERIQSLFDIRMGQLLERLIESERWTAVQEQAERWLALGDTPEPAFRALMLAYGARGDMTKVSSIYQRCVTELKEQFGLEPSAETRALYEGLLKGAQIPARPTVQPSGTVTFLFTDIEGSTSLLDSLGDQYASVLETHHGIMRRAILKWNGKEVDTQGDAFFVTFTRTLDAIQCVVDAQRAFSAQHWPEEKPVRVRMGLHTGEPLIASTGYVGMDVHRAARIGDAAHGGQVLLSQTTRELVMHELPVGLSIRDLGEFRLKDLKYPTPIYQLVIEGLPLDFPPIRIKFSGSEAPTPGEPPFKGLQFFDEADCDLFFGRELLTEKLMNRLQESRFLSVIIGASGSGKSSLVRAGLIPVLRRSDWQVRVMTPTANPIAALATELTRDSDSVTATATLIDDLMQDPRSLSLFLARQDKKEQTLLVIDQFEELFTLCRDEFERETFIDNLLTTLRQNQDTFTLILTLRADFYAHLAQYPELRDAVAKHQEYIGPMTLEELRRAIEEPARLGHWAFEPGLVDLILRDVGDEPGALPLLSHALLETWKRRAGHTLTLKGYADAGGVHGAIAHTAEGVYQTLSAEEQSIARDIFLRLTELGEGTEDTRRRVSFEELMSDPETKDEVRTVLNALADARLVTLSEDTAEVAHEALIREWPTLREWLNDDREGLQLHRRLTEAVREWEFLERDEGMLYRGAHLAQAREWAALHPGVLNAAEKGFIEASSALEEREIAEREAQQRRELEAAQKLAQTERQSSTRLRLRNRVITTVGFVALVLAVLAGVFGLQSNQHAQQAETNLGIADQQRAAALNAQATAVVEAQIRATQQAVAEANFRQAEAQRLALEANRLLQARGNPEQIALLSLRSMKTQYTPEGDAALVAASRLDYPLQLLIHPGWVMGAAFSPDGRYLLTGSRGKQVNLWDVATGQELRQFTGHTDHVWTVGISPDGKYGLTASNDKTVRLWDMATGQEVRRFMAGTVVWSATFSPDGKYILAAANDGTARLWDASTGEEIRHFIVDTETVIDVAFSPDGNYIVTGGADRIAKLWDVSTGKELTQFIGHTGAVSDVDFSPDGNWVLTGGLDSTARLWDAKIGTQLQQFTGHTNYIFAVAFSRDGKKVFTTSQDNTARSWDPETGQELQRYTSITFLTGLAISPDNRMLVTCSADGTVRLWSIEPRVELASFDKNNAISAVDYSPDGKSVLTGGVDGIARLWDAGSGQKLLEFIGHSDGINYGVAFSPDGRHVLTGAMDKTVRLWDTRTGQEIRQFIGHTGVVNSVAFSPDGKYIVTGGGDETVRLWDAESGQEVRTFSSDTQVNRVAFSPDGKYIISANSAGTAQLWDILTGALLREFTANILTQGIAFSPDGKTIVTAADDGIARLWDVELGKEVRQFIGHQDRIWSVTFSPDGNYIASASSDSTVRLWDTQTGQELRRFMGHTAGVENVAFSPDGKYILTGSDDGTARLWDVDYHTTMEYLCSRLLRDFTDEERAQYGIKDNTPTCSSTP